MGRSEVKAWYVEGREWCAVCHARVLSSLLGWAYLRDVAGGYWDALDQRGVRCDRKEESK